MRAASLQGGDFKVTLPTSTQDAVLVWVAGWPWGYVLSEFNKKSETTILGIRPRAAKLAQLTSQFKFSVACSKGRKDGRIKEPKK